MIDYDYFDSVTTWYTVHTCTPSTYDDEHGDRDICDCKTDIHCG